jgi:DNA (cytosine-5)-methyltransferase 1
MSINRLKLSFFIQGREKMKKTRGFNFIDLFCGCGGLSYGLEKAGHQCLLGVDVDARALESFAYNHSRAKTFHGDIRRLNAEKLNDLIGKNKIDMIVGGPPCQGFSTVGAGNTSDVRNLLFKEFVRIVRLVKPKVIVFENVTGLVASKNQFILHAIFREFEKLGFSMEARVLSAEEFGVPEKRRRTIIMGVRGGECRFPAVTHGYRGKKAVKTIREVWRSFKAKNGKVYNHEPHKTKKLKEIDLKRLACLPPGAGIRYESDEKKYLPKKLWWDINWATLPERRFRQTRLQRLAWNAPSPTILTSKTNYYHPKENRYLTCREAAACQSFPNDFVFYGSDTSIFRQIGNAVPPLLAEAIGREIHKLQFKKAIQKSKGFKKEHLKNAFDYHETTYVA